MSEVERLCDRIAIMYRGKILDSGTLEELRDRHREDDFEELFFGLLSQHEQDVREARRNSNGSPAGISKGEQLV
jgi:sodium transport system ATP-binding protein